MAHRGRTGARSASEFMASGTDEAMGGVATTAPGTDASATSTGATDGRRLRWTEHRAQRRAGFVAAGAQAIDDFGPGASAEQIAEVAGVSRTVLYRYFRDREDLRQAIAAHVVQAILDSVLPKLQLTAESTPRQVIAAAIGVIVGWLDEHPNLYYFLRSRSDGSSLNAVETTLADQIASLLKLLMMFFGMKGFEAEPGAYGIVGFVEASGSWWLSHRTMSRNAFSTIVCTGVWHLLEGTARDHGLTIEYDEPLPVAALANQAAVAAAVSASAVSASAVSASAVSAPAGINS